MTIEYLINYEFIEPYFVFYLISYIIIWSLIPRKKSKYDEDFEIIKANPLGFLNYIGYISLGRDRISIDTYVEYFDLIQRVRDECGCEFRIRTSCDYAEQILKKNKFIIKRY